MNLPHLAQRLFNTPLALHPSKAEVIMASVMDRFGISKIESSLAMEDDWYGYDDNRGRESRSDPGFRSVPTEYPNLRTGGLLKPPETSSLSPTTSIRSRQTLPLFSYVPRSRKSSILKSLGSKMPTAPQFRG